MKRVVALIAFALLTLPVLAADRTLLDDEDSWKLYTEPIVRVTDVNDNSATLVGIGVGAILNEQLNFGVEGNFLANDIHLDEDGNEVVRSFDWWYAGATVGYTLFTSDLIHLHVGSLFGGGQLHTHPQPASLDEESVAYAVIEPRVTLYINVAETVELGIGATYRTVSGFDLPNVDDGDMTGATGFVSVRVTEF